VLNIFSAGKHKSYTNFEDMDLKRTFTLQRAVDSTGFYTDLALEQMHFDSQQHLEQRKASQAPSDTPMPAGISFIHAAPGIVNTTWGKDFPFWLRLPLRALQQVLAKSPEECASLMVQHGLLSPSRRGPGFYLMAEDGSDAPRTDAHNAENRLKVWKHTTELLENVLERA
jgi:hypothetical protein